jgi:hypothetical protein
MQKKLALSIAELDYEFSLVEDYIGRGCSTPTYAVVVPSLGQLLQVLIEYSEDLNGFTNVGRLQIDNLGLNYIIY